MKDFIGPHTEKTTEAIEIRSIRQALDTLKSVFPTDSNFNISGEDFVAAVEKVLAQEDLFGKYMSNPGVSEFMIDALADSLGDNFPAIDIESSDIPEDKDGGHPDLDRADDAFKKLQAMIGRLHLLRLSSVGDRMFVEPEAFSDDFFIADRLFSERGVSSLAEYHTFFKGLSESHLDEYESVLDRVYKREPGAPGPVAHLRQPENSVVSLAAILCNADDERRSELANERFRKYILNPSVWDTGRAFADFCQVPSDRLASLVRDALSRFNIDEKIMLLWGAYPLSNMRAILDLEAICPGGAKILFEDFSIVFFDRYPTEVLAAQIDTRDDLDAAYGVLACSVEDENGAFRAEAFRKMIRSLFTQLGRKVLLRITEFNGSRDMLRRIITLGNRYNPKISFAVLAAHGSDDLIATGSDNAVLTKEDIAKTTLGKEKMSEYFVGGAPIVLASCETGKPRGMAERMAKKFGLNVIGPDAVTFLSGLDVLIAADGKGGTKVQLVPEYNDGKAFSYEG